MRQYVKVAAVQAAPVAFDPEKSLAKVASFTAKAAKEGADLVIFPEAFLSAYPWRYAFDATIGWREPRGRQWWAKYYDSSISLSSPEFATLQDIAKEHSVFLYVGLIENDSEGGSTLYCATVLIGKDGELLSHHRKLIPSAAERIVWSRGAGDGLKVADTELGKVGGLICWENYMPAARMAMYQQGIEIYIAPNADDLPAWTASMRHIAKEGRCFVISCNQFTRVSDFPADYPPFLPESHDRQPDGSKWQPESILNHGGTCVVGPLGEFVSEPVWDREGIVYAELGSGELIESRMDFDAVGSYSRPDIFELKVNTKAATSVVFN